MGWFSKSARLPKKRTKHPKVHIYLYHWAVQVYIYIYIHCEIYDSLATLTHVIRLTSEVSSRIIQTKTRSQRFCSFPNGATRYFRSIAKLPNKNRDPISTSRFDLWRHQCMVYGCVWQIWVGGQSLYNTVKLSNRFFNRATSSTPGTRGLA